MRVIHYSRDIQMQLRSGGILDAPPARRMRAWRGKEALQLTQPLHFPALLAFRGAETDSFPRTRTGENHHPVPLRARNILISAAPLR
jgi:hypothetical protein